MITSDSLTEVHYNRALSSSFRQCALALVALICLVGLTVGAQTVSKAVGGKYSFIVCGTSVLAFFILLYCVYLCNNRPSMLCLPEEDSLYSSSSHREIVPNSVGQSITVLNVPRDVQSQHAMTTLFNRLYGDMSTPTDATQSFDDVVRDSPPSYDKLSLNSELDLPLDAILSDISESEPPTYEEVVLYR